MSNAQITTNSTFPSMKTYKSNKNRKRIGRTVDDDGGKNNIRVTLSAVFYYFDSQHNRWLVNWKCPSVRVCFQFTKKTKNTTKNMYNIFKREKWNEYTRVQRANYDNNICLAVCAACDERVCAVCS